MRPAARRRPLLVQAAATGRRGPSQPASGPAAPAPRAGGGRTVQGVLDAIRRSPLGLDLPSNYPGLASVASALVRCAGPSSAAPRRRGGPPGGRRPRPAPARRGPRSARARPGSAPAPGRRRRRRRRAARRPPRAARFVRPPRRRARPSLLNKRPQAHCVRPEQFPVPAHANAQDEEEITEAAVRLVREHGLLDAKAMVASDLGVSCPLLLILVRWIEGCASQTTTGARPGPARARSGLEDLGSAPPRPELAAPRAPRLDARPARAPAPEPRPSPRETRPAPRRAAAAAAGAQRGPRALPVSAGPRPR
jgi:hypothetical protein